MDRRLLVLIVAAVALIGVVNATAFAYRWITGTVNIVGPIEAKGAACTGFIAKITNQSQICPTLEAIIMHQHMVVIVYV